MDFVINILTFLDNFIYLISYQNLVNCIIICNTSRGQEFSKMDDCFDEILKKYYENKELYNSLQGKIWVSNVINKLMTELEKNPSSYLRVENCLLFLINLCMDVENPDHYHTKGKSIEELSEQEKVMLVDLLKNEFLDLNN